MAILNLTDAERNAPGGQSTMQGGAQSAYNPTLDRQTTPAPTPAPSAPAPAPVAGLPTPQQPSIGQQLEGIQTEALRIQDILNQRQAGEAGGSGFVTSEFEEGPAFEPFDEEAARRAAIRNQRRLFQSEIDATNQVYDQLLNEARTEGRGRIGSQRAIAARGGLLGSDFAGAQKDKVQSFNTDVQRGIKAERQAAIGAIEGTIRTSVQEELAAKREARQLGAEEYSDFLAGKAARKENYKNALIQDMLTQGIDIESLSEEELAQYLRPAGLKADDVKATYLRAKAGQEATGAAADLETRKTEAEIAKIEADIANGKVITLGEGTMLYNMETGETFKNPKTYKPGSASGLSIGAGVLSQEAVADVHQNLNETRGQDGYADTGVYMDEFNGFVAAGGDPKDFVKEYDPNIYINPNDPTRSFLQTEMNKPSSDNLFLGSLGGLDIGSAITEAQAGE
jgi:hypothetical protein